jgi:hypothetical protein
MAGDARRSRSNALKARSVVIQNATAGKAMSERAPKKALAWVI